VAICHADRTTIEPHPRANAVDFFKGLFEGLGAKEDIEKFIKCMKEAEHIFEKIKEALQHLKKMNINDIKKGLSLLFSALKELFEMVKPCAETGSIIHKLINAITNANIAKIALHILMHPVAFVKDIEGAIEGFAKGDLFKAGKSIGDLLRIIFLTTEVDQANPIDFLKGLFDGLQIKEDVEKFLKCIKDLNPIFQKIKEALEILKHININDIQKGLKQLFEALKQLFEMIKPCAQVGSIIHKLISLISSCNILKIALAIITHPVAFVSDVVKAIESFAKGDLYNAGKAVGDILRIIFLARQAEKDF
jgi:uncharacterized protein YjgD (DUF1641 family)